MIAKMKKLTLLVSERSRDDFLLKLRQAGVMHIKHVSFPSSDEIKDVEEKLSLLNRAIDALSIYDKAPKEHKSLAEKDLIRYAEKIQRVSIEKDGILRSIHDIENRIEWFKPWGRFNPQDLKRLKENGITIRLYRLVKKEFKRIKDEYKGRITVLKKDGGYVYLAFISYRADERLDFDEVVLPDKGFDKLKTELSRLNERLEEVDSFLKEGMSFKDTLTEEASRLKCRLNFLNVRYGMKDDRLFSYLQGFCPQEYLERVISLTKSQGEGYLIEDPDDPDETPTFIKNPRWIRIISPVFKFMNTLPGYGEYDISLPFLIFFSIFFAMLIGDAGYGVLFLIITYLVRRRAKNLPREPFFLMYLLSIATIAWGAVNGTWFGIVKMARFPAFTDPNFMMYLCFIIGAVHLSIAHLIMTIRVINSLLALAQLGWILVIWGLFFTAGTLVIGRPFLPLAGYLLSIGTVLVLLFSNPRRNILKGILITLSDLPLKIISSFSDIVSYIRLFAVGYATVIVARSFNDMALAAGFSNVIRGLGAALILFLGHAINIALGIMAVIVHGIRLNMLEFSSHLNMQWSGKEYKPFKEE